MVDEILRVNHAHLSEIEKALKKVHDDLLSQISDLRTTLNKGLTTWDENTESRKSQINFDKKLDTAVKDLGTNMGKIRTALHDVANAAVKCEVQCVALVTPYGG